MILSDSLTCCLNYKARLCTLRQKFSLHLHCWDVEEVYPNLINLEHDGCHARTPFTKSAICKSVSCIHYDLIILKHSTGLSLLGRAFAVCADNQSIFYGNDPCFIGFLLDALLALIHLYLSIARILYSHCQTLKTIQFSLSHFENSCRLLAVSRRAAVLACMSHVCK